MVLIELLLYSHAFLFGSFVFWVGTWIMVLSLCLVPKMDTQWLCRSRGRWSWPMSLWWRTASKLERLARWFSQWTTPPPKRRNSSTDTRPRALVIQFEVLAVAQSWKPKEDIALSVDYIESSSTLRSWILCWVNCFAWSKWMDAVLCESNSFCENRYNEDLSCCCPVN